MKLFPLPTHDLKKDKRGLSIFLMIAAIIAMILFKGCDPAYSQGKIPETIIKHNGYVIYYNPSIMAPDSTSFTLTKADVNCGTVVRKDEFAADPLLKDGPKPSDFINPTKQPDSLQIDKGHTRSFKSSACNPINYKECFFVSGMYAQFHGFNNGDWKEFEEREQLLANTYTVHVINGYIGVQGHLKAGEIIPTYMYKAIYYNGLWEVYIAPNRPWVHGHPISKWKRTLTELNSKTGLKLK